MEKQSYHSIIISPHLDDAVFSCGSLIHSLTQQGKKVLVINVFDQSSRSETRKQEDRKASEILGYQINSLNWPEAPTRQKYYQQPKNLFTPLRPEGDLQAKTLAEALTSLLANYQFDRIYFPLGVGWHIDHLLCFEAAVLLDHAKPIYFYEDHPYCFFPGFTEARLYQLGSLAKLTPVSFVQQLGIIHRTHLGSVAPIGFQTIVEIVICKFLAGLSHRHQQSALFKLETQSSDNLMASFEAKIAACLSYKTQVPLFFKNSQSLKEFYLSRVTKLGDRSTYHELCWRIA